MSTADRAIKPNGFVLVTVNFSESMLAIPHMFFSSSDIYRAPLCTSGIHFSPFCPIQGFLSFYGGIRQTFPVPFEELVSMHQDLLIQSPL